VLAHGLTASALTSRYVGWLGGHDAPLAQDHS
jgi:hypothetical protein